MWKIREGCNPTICNMDTLMTDDFVFMDKDLIRDECDCIHKATCLAIIDLLHNNKIDEATKLIEWMQEV